MKDTSAYNFIGNFEANEFLFPTGQMLLLRMDLLEICFLKEAEAFYKVVSAKGIGNGYFEMFNFENFGGTPILGVNAPLSYWSRDLK